MINIFARCLIRFPVVTVWRVATATQDRGGWAGWRGGVLASRCCTSRWKLVLAAASCHGTTHAQGTCWGEGCRTVDSVDSMQCNDIYQ